jgi:hypothetical protein
VSNVSVESHAGRAEAEGDDRFAQRDEDDLSEALDEVVG